jgi:hypothetical protein
MEDAQLICNEELKAAGKAYPRTCAVHGLGPCMPTPASSVLATKANMSIQETKWRKFSNHVVNHILNYVLPQYGDERPDEPAAEYDAQECVNQAKRYLARFGKSQRPGEELRDLCKAAHWIQKAADRLGAAKETHGPSST